MALTPAAWFDAAHDAYGHVLAAIARHGVSPDPELRFVPAQTPTPYYEPATRTIGIGMPDPATVSGRLYWLYAARVLGYGDVEEAVSRQADQMPFMVAHELVHHLRHHYGATIVNDYCEEQVANVIALAFVHEHPAYRDRLPAMRAAAVRATQTLSLLAPEARPLVAGFRMSSDDMLLELQGIPATERRELRLAAEATDVPLGQLLVQAGIVAPDDRLAADAARAAAESYFNSVYMRNLLEYGYFHMAWIAAYLEHGDPPSLARCLDEYLLTPDRERARAGETRLLLSGLLRDAPDEVAPVVAELLTADAAPELLGALLDVMAAVAPRTQGTIMLALARVAAGQPRAVDCAHARIASASPEVRGAAAALLERSHAGDGSGREVIRALLRSSDDECRSAGARAAAELCDRGLAPALLCCLQTGGPGVRLLALQAIEKLAPDASLAARVMAAAADRDDAVRGAAIRCLGRHPSPDALPLLVGALDDEAESVRRAAATALIAHGGATPALRSVAGSWRGRTEAALLLHAIGEPDAPARLDELRDELLAAVRSLARRPADAPRHGVPPALLREVLAEQRRKLCFLVLRLTAARDGRADLERALDGLRWADAPARPGLLRVLKRGFPAELWPLLEGDAPDGPCAPRALPDAGLDDLLAGFDPFLRDLATTCPEPNDAKDRSMLSDIEKLLFLRALPLFAGVELSELQRLVDTCEVHRYQAGERVFEQGEDGDMLFVITAGRVAVEQQQPGGDVTCLVELGAGAWFGESAFFSDVPRSAGVRAILHSTLIGLHRAAVLRAGARNPSILLAMIRAMSERMADRMTAADAP